MIFSSLRNVTKVPIGGFILSMGGGMEVIDHHDTVNKEIKTAKSFTKFEDPETGWDRIKKMFQLDEYDNISPELHSIYNAGFLGLFVGLCYGGFIGSKNAYMNFMERNQATAFETHHIAKKTLQDSVTVQFAKTGWKLGWRMGVFAFMYMGTSTLISVYRNKYSISDYVVAGAVTGSVYKWNLGPRGWAAGGLVGGGLGLVAGGISVGILALTGTSMEEVRYWQYKWKTDREQAMKDGFEKGIQGTAWDHKNIIQDLHDIKVGVTRPNLDQLADEPVIVTKNEDETKKEEVIKSEELKNSEGSKNVTSKKK